MKSSAITNNQNKKKVYRFRRAFTLAAAAAKTTFAEWKRRKIRSNRNARKKRRNLSLSVHPEDCSDEGRSNKITVRRRSSASKNYLRSLSGRRLSEREAQGVLFEKFPMHCVTIQDLLSFEKLHDHDTVKRMGKIPERHSRAQRCDA